MSADEDLDHSVMPRGKFGPKQGNPQTANWVAEHEPQYLVWAFENWTPKPCSDLLYRECRKDVAENQRHGRVAKDQED